MAATGSRQERHGKKYFPEYQVWLEMKGRCTNPNNKRYGLYGGRGITICAAWLNSFETFLRDMGRRPGTGREWLLERDNNDLGYSPENCRWATYAAQSRNKRNNKRYTYKGRSMILVDWAEATGIPYATLKSRVRSYGWTIARAVETPVNAPRVTSRMLTHNGMKLPMCEMARRYGLDPRTVAGRLRKGLSVEESLRPVN